MVKAVFDNLAASNAEESLHRRHQRRRHAHKSRSRSGIFGRARRRRARAFLRPRLGRHRRREQGLDQNHRREHGQFRARLLRLRFEEIGRDDDLASALRPACRSARRISSRRRNSSPVISRFCSSATMCSKISRRTARSCLIPFDADDVFSHLPENVQRQLIEQEAKVLRHRREQSCARHRNGRAHQHRDASRFFAISGVLPPRSDRCDQEFDPQDLRKERRRNRGDEFARGRSDARASFTRWKFRMQLFPLHPDPTDI